MYLEIPYGAFFSKNLVSFVCLHCHALIITCLLIDLKIFLYLFSMHRGEVTY